MYNFNEWFACDIHPFVYPASIHLWLVSAGGLRVSKGRMIRCAHLCGKKQIGSHFDKTPSDKIKYCSFVCVFVCVCIKYSFNTAQMLMPFQIKQRTITTRDIENEKIIEHNGFPHTARQTDRARERERKVIMWSLV